MTSDTCTAPLVLVEQTARIGRVTLNRPERLNSLDFEVIDQCLAALTRFKKAGVPVVVLTGAGRGFCAGADLGWLGDAIGDLETGGAARSDRMHAALGHGQALIRAIRSYPGIVVCAMNGPAVGGGAGLALAGDMTIAAKSAYFALPFVPTLGLVPDLGGIAFMAERIGEARTLGLSLLGDRLDAEPAARDGLIWACHDDQAFAAEVETVAECLAALSPDAVLAAKDLVRRSRSLTLDAYLEAELDAQARLFADPAGASAVSSAVARHMARD